MRWVGVGPTRREEWDGTYEVVVPTPAGAQWMPESQARNVPKPDHWAADYNPAGRPADIPASYYRNLPIRKREEPLNFNQEMAAALGDSFKSPRMAGSGGRQGGGQKPYAKDPQSVQYGRTAPNFLSDLLFRKRRY
jgi:hypothetical protein